jgi:hypothetical protein
MVLEIGIIENKYEYYHTPLDIASKVALYLWESTAYHVLASVAVSVRSDAEVLARQAHLTLLVRVYKEAHCIQCHLQLRTCTNKHGANRFHHIVPLVVKFQDCSFLEHKLTLHTNESSLNVQNVSF